MTVIEVVNQFGENKDGNGYVMSTLLYGSSTVHGPHNSYKTVESIQCHLPSEKPILHPGHLLARQSPVLPCFNSTISTTLEDVDTLKDVLYVTCKLVFGGTIKDGPQLQSRDVMNQEQHESP